MQLRDYSSYFQPEEFDALIAAYEAAWQELWAKRLTLPSEQVPVLERNLSQMILASACNGKRDVEQLKEIALRGVAGESRISPSTRIKKVRPRHRPGWAPSLCS